MMNHKTIYLHHFEPISFSNGPGCRSVIWVQGCRIHCPGCFNPLTHPFLQEKKVTADSVWQKIQLHQKGIEGITITGGEPFDQAEALISLLDKVRCQTNLSVVVFSGYNWQELKKNPVFPMIIPLVDVLIAGRYHAQGSSVSAGFIQPHKTYYFLTNRYNKEDLTNVPPAEILIDSTGQVLLSGANPVVW